MKLLTQLLWLFLYAALVENIVFARAVHTNHLQESSGSYRAIFSFSGLVALLSMTGGALTWVIEYFFSTERWWVELRWGISLVCLITAYLLWMLLHRYVPVVPLDGLSMVAGLGITAYATILLSMANHLPLLQTIFYCGGSAVGLMIALLLVHSGMERLTLCPVPRAFSGFPVLMIYLGILSMAIYGLIGHQLPT